MNVVKQSRVSTNYLILARQSFSLLDFGDKPINKHLASDSENQTMWLALIDKKVRSASLQLVGGLGWRQYAARTPDTA